MPDETPEQTIRANLGLAVLILHAAGHLGAAEADRAFRSVVGSEDDKSRVTSQRISPDAFERAMRTAPDATPARV